MYRIYSKAFVLLCLFAVQVLTEQCVTPNGKTGKCVALKSCAPLHNAFQNPKKGTEDHLRKFLCTEGNKDKKKNIDEDENNEFMVCCGLSFNLTESEHSTSGNSNSVGLENVEECGKIHSVFCSTAEEEISVPVLPWLVKVLVADASGNAYAKCSGALINERYIITGAQCIDNKALTSGKRLVVRFGNKYVDSENPAEECTDVQYFEVEETVVHPFYHSQSKFNDIALVRLNKTVLDKALYRPVCLPLSEGVQAKPEDKFSIGRWDEILEQKSSKQCKLTYENKNITGSATVHEVIPVEFGNAITITTKDDIGTPVILSHNEKWYLEGVISQSKNCENDHPGTYTKISDYLPWIQANMKPWPAEQCITPEGGKGKCLSLGDCPSLLKSSINPTKTLENHLRKYICEEGQFYGTFRVCCDQSLSFSVSTSSNSADKFGQNGNSVQITNTKQCGFQKQDNSSEFPWLARIIPANGNNTLCLGSLINDRYVLTEAWCSFDLTNSSSIRLGEYSEGNKFIFEEIGIEEITIHPFFVYWSRLNNIALLRLNKTVSYTNRIQPICLPTEEKSFAKLGDTLYTSGWDYASPEKGITKKKVSTILIPHEKCNLPFVQPVEQYSICTTTIKNNTEISCFGDSGGPLMFVHNNQWHVEGVVSTLDCNNQGQQVHTKVSEYLKWIAENMKPW